jgi:GNAT superfamily N-acetyltransferase
VATQKKLNSSTVNITEYSIRLFNPESDSVEELTDLLHKAYKRLADMGLNFVATDQNVEYTRRYLEKGKCFVMSDGEKLAGTVFYYTKMWDDAPDIFKDKDTVLFGKFAVLPELQRLGLGRRLMDFVEAHARENGKSQIVLDTSEKAYHLIDYYNKRGYEYVHHWQWPVVNYRSVVMCKKLT